MRYEDQFDAIVGGRKLAQQGITISRKKVISTDLGKQQNTSGKGRPPTNIFIKSPLYPEVVSSGLSADLSFQRTRLLLTHQQWVQKFSKIARTSLLSPSDQYLPSIVFKDRENPIWTVYFAAELAWILMGHIAPENRAKRPQHLEKKDTFVAETRGFWVFLNEHIERNIYRCKNRGPKPDVEKLFKTALATFVARKLIAPTGGNWRKLPTPRDISQVWFVIFGEEEHHDNIKKRLPRLVRYCERFPLEWGSYKNGEPEKYPLLGRALEEKFDPASAKRKRAARMKRLAST